MLYIHPAVSPWCLPECSPQRVPCKNKFSTRYYCHLCTEARKRCGQVSFEGFQLTKCTIMQAPVWKGSRVEDKVRKDRNRRSDAGGMYIITVPSWCPQSDLRASKYIFMRTPELLVNSISKCTTLTKLISNQNQSLTMPDSLQAPITRYLFQGYNHNNLFAFLETGQPLETSPP